MGALYSAVISRAYPHLNLAVEIKYKYFKKKDKDIYSTQRTCICIRMPVRCDNAALVGLSVCKEVMATLCTYITDGDCVCKSAV